MADMTTTETTTETTTTDPITTVTMTIDTHLRAYCEPDAARRADLLAAAWAAGGTLVDPPFDGQGLEAIAGMTDVLLQHYPGHSFRRTTTVDAHHTFARYGWELIGQDGTIAVDGTDFVEFDAAGRIDRIVGFFGPLTLSS